MDQRCQAHHFPLSTVSARLMNLNLHTHLAGTRLNKHCDTQFYPSLVSVRTFHPHWSSVRWGKMALHFSLPLASLDRGGKTARRQGAEFLSHPAASKQSLSVLHIPIPFSQDQPTGRKKAATIGTHINQESVIGGKGQLNFHAICL